MLRHFRAAGDRKFSKLFVKLAEPPFGIPIRVTLVFDPFGICTDADHRVRDVQDEKDAFRRIEELLRRDPRFETVSPKTYIVEAECWEHFQSYRGVSGIAFQEITPRKRLADVLGEQPPDWLTDRYVLDWDLLNREFPREPGEDRLCAQPTWTSNLFAPIPTITSICKEAILTGTTPDRTGGNLRQELLHSYKLDSTELQLSSSWEDAERTTLQLATRLSVHRENRLDEPHESNGLPGAVYR